MERTAVVSSENGASKRRSRARSQQSDVQRVLERMERQVQDQAERLNNMTRQFDLYQMAVQRSEGKLDTILTMLGNEEEDGEGGYVGTGLLGRMRRVEKGHEHLNRKYREWISWGAGFCTAGGLMVVAIWWLIGDKLELVLKQ